MSFGFRSQAARTNGCSFQTFLDLMKEDDQFDADLTDLGRAQAGHVIGIVAFRFLAISPGRCVRRLVN